MVGPRGVAGKVELCLECHLVMPCLNGAIVAFARDHPHTTLSVREIRERLGQAAARAYDAQAFEVRSDRRSDSVSQQVCQHR
jgi:hypothetical protein